MPRSKSSGAYGSRGCSSTAEKAKAAIDEISVLNSQGLAVVFRNPPGKKKPCAIQQSTLRSMKSGAGISLTSSVKTTGTQGSESCHIATDSGIVNCNRSYWLKNAEEEAKNLWNLGKELGMEAKGDEAEIRRRLVQMEHRDATQAKGVGDIYQ
jgi:hypothetical protein